MKQSPSIQALAAALSKAQGDRHKECRVLPELLSVLRPLSSKHEKDPAMRFFLKICYGSSDCWYWRAHIDPLGYGRYAYDGENKAHRVAWKLFNGAIPEGLKVLHRCDVRNCVNPEHLFLGTQKENVQDMIQKGRRHTNGPVGVTNWNAKLTDAQVLEMRQLRNTTGISHRNLAKQFGVTTMTAWRACTNNSWNHLK